MSLVSSSSDGKRYICPACCTSATKRPPARPSRLRRINPASSLALAQPQTPRSTRPKPPWSVRTSMHYIIPLPTYQQLILTLMARAPSCTRVRGPWGPLIARRPCPQGDLAVCTGFGSCTVSIFPCPASALGLGRPLIFCPSVLLTLTLCAP